MQNLGNANNLQNENYSSSKRCPKGINKGFVATPKGVFYCIRGAMNNIETLKVGPMGNPKQVKLALDSISVRNIDSQLKYGFAQSNKKYNNQCDLCEELCNN